MSVLRVPRSFLLTTQPLGHSGAPLSVLRVPGGFLLTLRTLRGTPECPKGWVSRKLHGTLRTLRGTPECPKGWVSRKPPGTILGVHSGAPPSVLMAG